MKKDEVIKHLIDTNNYEYQILKSVEELNELSTALMQYFLKGGLKTTEQDVIDEIGDVMIRINILYELFDSNQIDKRYDEKLYKFSNYIKEGKYIGRI